MLDEKGIITKEEVADGADPLIARQKERAGQTIKALCDAYIERHAKPRNRTWRGDQNRINRRVLPTFGRLLVKSVTKPDVANWHHSIGSEKPYEANRCLALFSKMFNCAKEWGFVSEDTINPARGIERFDEEERDRWVSPQEIPRLTKSIDEIENIYISSETSICQLHFFLKGRVMDLLFVDLLDI